MTALTQAQDLQVWPDRLEGSILRGAAAMMAAWRRAALTSPDGSLPSMKTSEYKSRTLAGRQLHPETLMMGYGYDPACRKAR